MSTTEALGPPAPRLGQLVADRAARWAGGLARWVDALPLPGLTGTVLAGAAGTVAVAVGGTFAGGPWELRQPGAWFFGMTPDSTPARIAGAVAVYVGLAVATLAWLQLLRLLRTRPGEVSTRSVAIAFVLWVLPLLIVPPMFSRDVYSYAADGQMAVEHINPYRFGPEVLATPSYVLPVSPIWRATPTPYGPLFIDLARASMNLGGHHEAVAVELLRLAALGGIALAGVAVVDLARGTSRSSELALALVLLNPVTLFALLAPGHNDALMIGLLAGGLALARRRQVVGAVVLCALAAAIKIPAYLGVAYAGWMWSGPGTPTRRRVLVTGGWVLGGLVVLGVVSSLTGLGWGWTASLGTPAVVHTFFTPTTALASVADHFVRAAGFGPGSALVLSAIRVLGLVAAAAAGAWLLWRSDQLGVALAAAMTLLLLVALGPIVQPWYLAWGIVLFAAAPGGRWVRLLVAVSVYALLGTVPDFAGLLSTTGFVGPVLGLVLVAAVCASAFGRSRRAEVLVPV